MGIMKSVLDIEVSKVERTSVALPPQGSYEEANNLIAQIHPVDVAA